MERFWPKQMKLDALTQPGWGDAADHFHEGHKKYGTTEYKVPAVVKPHSGDDAANPIPITFEELIESLNIIPRMLQMPRGTSRPGSCNMRLGSGRLQSNKHIA